MNDGTGFVSVSGEASNDLTTTRIVTQQIVSGKTFQFRYRAYNIFGWSEYSTPQTAIIASTIPSKPLNIVTANEEALTTVKITWDAPTDFGGDDIAIEAYLISIYD